MSETAARQKVDLSAVLNENVRAQATPRRKESVVDAKFAQIQANPFFSVVFNPDLKPEQKKEELTKLRIYEGTKEENRTRQKEYDLFKEYLQEQRELMAGEIIKLTDTDTFAELQQTYRDINDALIAFDDDMKPLTDTLDAVYALRTSGKTLDAFKEIKEDEKYAAQHEQDVKNAEDALEQAKRNVSDINSEIAVQHTKKGMFGFGGLTTDAKSRIATLEVKLEEAIQMVSDAEDQLTQVKASSGNPNSQLSPELLAAKDKLKELLDLTSAEHSERQKSLVHSAQNFIETSKERIGSIRNHLAGMDEQIDTLQDTNKQMTSIYAILTEAEKDAQRINQEKRDGLAAAPTDENLIDKMNRESLQQDIDEFIKSSVASTVDTQATYADLASGAIRILTMKDANQNQMQKAREMQSRGVAGIADRLATVLNAVSGAAVSEAQSLANDTHRRMMESTNQIAQKDSIRVAMGIQDTNDDLQRVMSDLESYGEVSKSSTEIIRKGLGDMQDNLDQIAKIRDEVQASLREATSVASEVSGGHTGSVKVKSPGTPSPFKFGKTA